MSTKYTVVKGDCLSAIANRHGFADYRTIYNHPDNAEFKQSRPDPNLIYPGDVLWIPEKNPGEKPGNTEKKHKYKKKGKKVKFRVQVMDDEDEGFSDKKYELKIGEDTLEGNTDGSGFLEHEIPADASRGTLNVFTDDENLKVVTWEVAFGHLDPHDTDEGAKGRLKNLNFYFGEVNSTVDDEPAKRAIKEFQKKNGIDESGELDDTTRSRLQSKHDVKT